MNRPRPCCSSSWPVPRAGIPAFWSGVALGAYPVFQTPQESGAGQHRDNITGTPCNCCPLSNAANTPERWSWCWRGWTAGCLYSMSDASSLPRKHRPVRHLFEAATRLPQLPPSQPPTPRSRQKLRLKLSNYRAQSRIKKKLALRQLTIRTQPGCGSSHRPGGRRSCSRRDGRRCSRPTFRGCPFDEWLGNWGSTETR